MRPEIDVLSARDPTHDGDSGINIVDPIQGVEFPILTDREVAPQPTSTDRFSYPVDHAVEIDAGHLMFPQLSRVVVRRQTDGNAFARWQADDDPLSLRPSTAPYLLEISPSPVAVYVLVDAELRISVTGGRTDLEVAGEGSRATVALGIRSYHDHPAETITIPEDADALLEALPLLGSALKTTSPERSFPTLRGHPPLIDFGESLEIPPDLEPPQTGIVLELPPTPRYLYPAAPLTYYLGADVAPASAPRLVAPDADLRYDLPSGDAYDDALATLLTRMLTLDTIVRTEGFYRVESHERNRLEARLDEPPDWARLYDLPLDERTAAYLDLPDEEIDRLLPEWNLSAHVEPVLTHATVLPFLVDELAQIRCRTPRPPQPVNSEEVEAIDEFTRAPRRPGDAGRPDPRPDPNRTAIPSVEETITLPSVEAQTQTWIGSGFPIGAARGMETAYHQRHEKNPTKRPISITIICNAEEMTQEAVVEEYWIRELVEFDVTIHHNVPPAQLHELLTEPTDLLHYIGHVDRDGLYCPPQTAGQSAASDRSGTRLDIRTLPESDVNVRAFLLNACASYQQGLALIDRGAAAGVATLASVENEAATRVGRILARALNIGMPIRAALEIANRHTVTGRRYVCLGDGSMQLVQTESGVPYYVVVRPAGSSEPLEEPTFEITVSSWPTRSHGPGTQTFPYVAGNSEHYLAMGDLETFTVTATGLLDFLDKERMPVDLDGTLRWSDTITERNLMEIN